MNEPFTLDWLERHLHRDTRTLLIPGGVLFLFFAAGTIYTVRRAEYAPVIVLLLLAGVPGFFLLKGGLSSSASHPLLRILRLEPSRVTDVRLEWRGGGDAYRGTAVLDVKQGRPYRVMAPKGREEELAAWLRTIVNSPVDDQAAGPPGSQTHRTA